MSNQQQTLIDWLYIDDYNHNLSSVPKQGALILFPSMIDRWNIASLIVHKWEGYNVVIVTDHPDQFINTLMNADDDIQDDIQDNLEHMWSLNKGSNHKWTDLELVQFPLIKYIDIDDINHALHNTEIDIILFDDARMLATVASGLNFNNVKPKIIVLTSWGDTVKQLDVITSKLPGLQLLTINVINNTNNVTWYTAKVQMSDRQRMFYNLVHSTTPSRVVNEDNGSVIYPITKMMTLYTYPDNIVFDILSDKSYPEYVNLDQSYISDKLDDNSWLNASFINTLDDDGPKLVSVLDDVISNWPNRQIISTRFNHRYGVDLIASFFQLLTQNGKNPYDINEIFHVSCTDDYETILNTLHKFNESKSAILISNIIPFIPIRGISVIHIVDSYSFLTLKMIIDKCHKNYLNKGGDLSIHCHIATFRCSMNSSVSLDSLHIDNFGCDNMSQVEKTADEVLYEILINNVNEANRIYSGLVTSSASIIFRSDVGLVVM